MAGGIVPRDVIPEPLIPQHVPVYPVMPVNSTVPDVLEKVSKIAQEVGGTFSHIQARAQRVEDATELAKRTMGFENDIDATLDNIKSTRDLHKTAPDDYTRTVNELSQKWTKDLRPDLQAHLTKVLTPKLIAGRREMVTLRNNYLIDDAKTTADAVQTDMVDRAGRLDVTDEAAFARVNPRPGEVTSDLEGTTTGPTRGGAYQDYIKSLVDANLMKAEDAQKRVITTLDAMAYRRLQRMSISDNPGLVQQALDILKKDEDQKGSTFAVHLSDEHRNGLIQAAQGQRDHLISQAREDWKFADEISRRRKADMDAEQKQQDEGEITQFVQGVFRGDRGTADLVKMNIGNRALNADPSRYEHLQDLIDIRGRKGGITNWALYNQFRSEIVESRGAANITDRLLKVTAKPGGIAWDDADKLMQMSAQVGERSIFKDDFFQAGQKDLDRSLAPQIGIVDIGGAKAQRHAEASREFFDRAQILVQKGEREKLPQIAREITDRFIKQAPQVAVGVRETPQHTDTQGLVNAYLQQYGLPEKWSPATTAEFNRQARILKNLLPPPTVAPAAALPSKTSKQPNPIQ